MRIYGSGVADLVFVPTLAWRYWPTVGHCSGQDLHLNRTVLSNNKLLPYVGRFACDWHRLATTDPHPIHAPMVRPQSSSVTGAYPKNCQRRVCRRHGHDGNHPKTP